MENKANLSSNIIWNTVGSLFYFGCQWLLSVAVVKFSPDYTNAGILSLAMSISGVFYVISLFNVRNYQVSDSDGSYTAGDYILHRAITCALSMIVCIIFVLLNSYYFMISLSIISFMVVKIAEAFADVLHGEAQKIWRLDIAGKSYIIRGLLLISVFSFTLIISENLALSIFLMSLSNVIPLIFYDYRKIKIATPFTLKTNTAKMRSLSKICLPMVGYGICSNAVMPISKYFLEFYHGEQTLGYYATISSIAVLVQAFVAIIFTPFVGIFNELYRTNDKRKFALLFLKIFALLVAVTSVAMLAVFTVGEFALSLIFGAEIVEYVYLLYPTVAASSLTALVWLLGMILVVMRDSITLLSGAALGLALSILLSLLTIPKTVYYGTNLSTILSLSLISIIYISRFVIYLISKKHTCNKEG